MSRSDLQRCYDILDAGDEVALIVQEGREAFSAKSVNRRALERLLGIVGEAARTLTDETRTAMPEVPWADVIGLRTLLTHAYFRVNDGVLWESVTVDLPAVMDAVRAYIQGR